ncbi:MAG: flagellar assembly protein T N-terminal domain-containing protein [Thalassotalea sp.]
MLSFTATAQWFETQGQAYINNGDKKVARAKAVENALKKTLLVAGASVSSIQQVVNGLLTKDELNIRATGIINSFEIISESYIDDLVEVSIRADIFPQEKQCFAADYRKTLLLSRSHLRHREQANIGGIYDLDKSVIKQLATQLKKDSRYLQTKTNIKNKTNFSRLHESQEVENIKMLSKSLAGVSDSQFVLYSEITDISIDVHQDQQWKFWQEAEKSRHFNFSVYIYDGINGEQVFDKTYQSTSYWDFDQRDTVTPSSQRFWQSKYGTNITRLLADVALDIDELLMCQPTQGTIVSIEGNHLLINLGKRHGVQLEDKFSLLANSTFSLANGKSYAGFNVSPYQLKVSKVTRDSAILTPVNDEQLGNIQINDLAVRH